MRNLKAGVVGLGVGERHIVSYDALPGVQVEAVCDLDPQKLATVAERYDVRVRSTDFRAVTEHPDIDLVSICSYDEAHVEQAISAFRHGKHVMMEKPIALGRRHSEALLTAQQASGRLLTSNLILRRSPRFLEVRELVRGGALGDVFYMEGDYLHHILWKITEGWRGQQDFYCVTYGGGIHLIDLMRWILGDEVTEVTGMGTDLAVRGSDYRWPETIVNLLRFAGGCIAKTATSFAVQRPQIHTLNIYGTKGTFVNDIPIGRLWSGDRPEDESIIESAYPGIEKGDLLPDFVAAIREGRQPEVSVVDVFRVMDVCFAAWDAVATAKTVNVTYSL